MNERTVWLKLSPLTFALDTAVGRLEIQYEAAGFQARWVVLQCGTALAYASDYTEARERAEAIARGLRRKAAA